MRAVPALAFGCVVFLFVCATTIPGCGKRTEDDEGPAPRGGKVEEVSLKPFKAPFDGTIQGKVTLDGSAPVFAMLADLKAKPECHAPDQQQNGDQAWIVDDKGGVGYVVIWLAAPKDSYFDLDDKLRTRKDSVVMDQPYCAFVPHVVSAFPKYFDGKKHVPTGQEFIVKNSAKITHNTKWGGDAMKNKGGNPTLAPGESVTLPVNPVDKIQIQCNIHSWMGAHAFVFDHPFHAVTKLDGSFEIKNVPTGVPLAVIAWHDGAQYFYGGKAGTMTTFNPGVNKLELKATRK